MDTKDGILTQRHAVDQPDSAFRPSPQRHKGAADERAVVDRVLLTSNDDAQVLNHAPAETLDAKIAEQTFLVQLNWSRCCIMLLL